MCQLEPCGTEDKKLMSISKYLIQWRNLTEIKPLMPCIIQMSKQKNDHITQEFWKFSCFWGSWF